MNRLIARVGEGVADAAAGVAVAVQDAPERIRQEWDLFQEEVKAEAERLQHEDQPRSASAADRSGTEPESLQQRIDRLRAQVADSARAWRNGLESLAGAPSPLAQGVESTAHLAHSVGAAVPALVGQLCLDIPRRGFCGASSDPSAAARPLADQGIARSRFGVHQAWSIAFGTS